MLNVHVCRVQLVSQVQCCVVESIAHLSRLIDALVEALLARCLRSKFHTCTLDSIELLLCAVYSISIFFDYNGVLSQSVLHVRQLAIEEVYAGLEASNLFVHQALILQVVIDDLLIVFSEKVINFLHLFARPVHVLVNVCLALE